jgi:hypothetical protein
MGNLRERDHLGELVVDGRIFRKWDMGVWTVSSWLRIRDRWRALVNSVMNFRVP